MKYCIVQPYFSKDYSDIDKCHKDFINILDSINEEVDVIVLPEYSDLMAATRNRSDMNDAYNKYHKEVEEKVKEFIRKHNCIAFVNYFDIVNDNFRNTTFAYDKKGNVVGKYYKFHLAPSEYKTVKEGGNELDYSYKSSEYVPYTITIDGIKYGFLTCYDFYFYEDFIKLARENVDVIIGCSHQRSDLHDALTTNHKFLSYQTNSYLVRSSVSLGIDSPIGGCSTITTPKGEVLVDMKSEIGYRIVDINPKDKYYKPAGFKGKEKAHYEYVDDGRRYIENKNA